MLALLLDPDTPWPPSAFDALSAAGGQQVLRFRSEVGAANLAGIFRTPDDLATQVAAGVSNLGLNRQMVERALEQTAVGPNMAPFLDGEVLTDTTVIGIRDMVASAGSTRSVLIDLGEGNRWWSTRLYLLAILLETLTPVRQLVFSHQQGGLPRWPARLRCGRDYAARSHSSPRSTVHYGRRRRPTSSGRPIE